MIFYFDFNISIITLILLSITFICAIILLFFYRKRISCIYKHQETCDKKDASSFYNAPSASIIVYADDEATNLKTLLPQILEQDYHSPYEVIVVNDGACESTRDVVNEFEMRYSNLYLTFTPDRSRSLSRKKLALTLGIKAARHEVIILLNANSRVNSNKWLAHIARNFNDTTDIVIGYATPHIDTDSSMGKRRRAFDRIAEAVTYLSAAIYNKPYRGFSYNLAYRKSRFFENKGFSRSLNLHFGEDDVFINEICSPHNTAVELSQDSIVECRFHNTINSHKELKQRYCYTAKFIRKASRRIFGFYSCCIWIWLIASLGAILTSLPNLFTLSIATILALTLWIPIIIAWRKASIALQSRRLCTTIPWFTLIRPFYNALYKIKSKRNYRRNHTWIK